MRDWRMTKLILGCGIGYIGGMYIALHLPYVVVPYVPFAGGLFGATVVQLPRIIRWLIGRAGVSGGVLAAGVRLLGSHWREVLWACCAIELGLAYLLGLFAGVFVAASHPDSTALHEMVRLLTRPALLVFLGALPLAFVIIIVDFGNAEHEESGSAFRGSKQFVLLGNPATLVLYQLPRIVLRGIPGVARFSIEFVRDGFAFAVRCLATPFIIILVVLTLLHRHPTMLIILDTALIAFLAAHMRNGILGIVLGFVIIVLEYGLLNPLLLNNNKLDSFLHGFFS